MKKHSRSKGAGNRGNRNEFADVNEIERNILKGLNSLPNGRLMDTMAQNGKFWDRNTRLFLRPRGIKEA